MSQLALFAEASPGTAELSDDMVYRYSLGRRWSDGGRVNFVMLNPSKADAVNPDPTMTRCVGFARSWGYGGLELTNLYAFRATEPKDMLAAVDPVGPLNDEFIVRAARSADLVVCGWGANADPKRAAFVLGLIRGVAGKVPHALRMTKGGQPTHPLFLPATLRPVPMG
jgi:hypothetical protein